MIRYLDFPRSPQLFGSNDLTKPASCLKPHRTSPDGRRRYPGRWLLPIKRTVEPKERKENSKNPKSANTLHRRVQGVLLGYPLRRQKPLHTPHPALITKCDLCKHLLPTHMLTHSSKLPFFLDLYNGGREFRADGMLS